MTRTTEQVYLLGGELRERFRFHRPVARLRSRKEIHKAILQAPRKASIWLATRSESIDELLREVAGTGRLQISPKPRRGRQPLVYPSRVEKFVALEELVIPVATVTAHT